MSARPTPRTASAMMEIPSRFDSIWVVPAEVACDLESELGDALQERDEARGERDALRDAVNALHDYVHGKRNDEKDISEILNGAMKI